jgi:hypothetical protein
MDAAPISSTAAGILLKESDDSKVGFVNHWRPHPFPAKSNGGQFFHRAIVFWRGVVYNRRRIQSAGDDNVELRLIRHATFILDFGGVRLLVDPVLSPAGAMPY